MNIPMILRTAKTDVVVGQIYRPEFHVTFDGIEHPPQPLFIVREATFEEWAAAGEHNAIYGDEPGRKYYEVHVD